MLHVDVKEGQTEVIIRFDSAKAADEVSVLLYANNNTNEFAMKFVSSQLL